MVKTDSSANPSLISRIQQCSGDDAAWCDFVDRYGPEVLAWASRWTGRDADARAVTRELLNLLYLRIKGFRYDPNASGFRAWLLQAARDVGDDLVGKARSTRGASDDGEPSSRMSEQAGGDGLAEHLRALIEREVLDKALELAQKRVEPIVWQSFFLTRILRQPVVEAAERLSVSLGDVYAHRRRVMKIVKEETTRLGERGESDEV